jgi:hypothetical protein
LSSGNRTPGSIFGADHPIVPWRTYTSSLDFTMSRLMKAPGGAA